MTEQERKEVVEALKMIEAAKRKVQAVLSKYEK